MLESNENSEGLGMSENRCRRGNLLIVISYIFFVRVLSLWPSDYVPFHHGARALPEWCAVGEGWDECIGGYYAISTALRTAFTNFYENRGFCLIYFFYPPGRWFLLLLFLLLPTSLGGGGVVFFFEGLSDLF